MSTHTADISQLIPLREAATLGFGSYPTLRKYIKQGSLPATRLGNRYFVTRECLETLTAPVQVAQPEAIKNWAEKAAAEAPPLTEDQRVLISSLLGGLLR